MEEDERKQSVPDTQHQVSELFGNIAPYHFVVKGWKHLKWGVGSEEEKEGGEVEERRAERRGKTLGRVGRY